VAEDFKGFRPRLDMKGYTSLPNEFFDDVLPTITSLSELKVLLAVFRKTYGWVSHIDPETGQPVFKENDAISVSQFKALTGLSSPSCVDGIKRGMEDGYLERVKEGTFHGGDSSRNESAVYRIKQMGGEPTPLPPGQIQPDYSKVKPCNLGDIDMKKHMKNDMALNDVSDSDDPEDILAEFFPKQETEEAPKKKESKTFKNKPMEKWTANDLLAYFNTTYKAILGFSAGPITAKDRTLAKKLLEGYETTNLVTALSYYLNNFKTISYLPSGHPAFNIFFGYRKSLIPEALDPTGGKKTSGTNGQNKTMREFNGDEDKGGYQW
jgi:hypothetical protein